MNANKEYVKIPVLTDHELIEMGKIMHENKDNELALRRFWKKIYGKRGLIYKKVFYKEEP